MHQEVFYETKHKAESKTKRHIQLQVPAEVYKRFRALCLEEDTNMRAKASRTH